MRRSTQARWALILAGALATSAAPFAFAGVQEGQPAPDFTKNQLDSPVFGSTTPRSLSDYAGKVIFLFVMGYN